MNKDDYHFIWAPDESPWSRWAKPVLFAQLEPLPTQPEAMEAVVDTSWAPPPGDKVALVLDLPGAESVLVGVALAGRGYRPVPLYNALALPFHEPVLDPFSGRRVAAVDVLPIVNALKVGALQLAQTQPPPEAPPAFLLHANRHGDGQKMLPDEFDNRSVLFTTDFPSSNFLVSQGIQRALLVQKNRMGPQTDVAHILRRWQDGGIKLQQMQLDSFRHPELMDVPRPSWYGMMFQRVLASFGLRRSHIGGFGAWVPETSGGG